MRSSKRINTDVQDEEAALLAEKNDPFTLSFMQFVTMMVNVLKYSNSAYMSFFGDRTAHFCVERRGTRRHGLHTILCVFVHAVGWHHRVDLHEVPRRPIRKPVSLVC